MNVHVHVWQCMTVLYTLKEAKAIMRRLTEALVYMHDNGEYVPSNYSV